MPSTDADPTLVVSEVFGPTFQGEGLTLGRRAAFLRLGRCNLDCRWCFVPDTPVLRPDWTWTPIGELMPGDEVVGRTVPQNGRHGALVVSTVVGTGRHAADVVTVDGVVSCTPDHRFWVAGDRSHRSGWREAHRLGGVAATFLSAPPTLDPDRWRIGYLAGVADGDGCFWDLRLSTRPRPYRRFRLAMNDAGVLERFRALAAVEGFELRLGDHRHTGFAGPGTMSALWLTVDAAARAFESSLAADDDDESWAWGYLGGMIDAEGSLSQNVLRIAQDPVANPATFTRLALAVDRLGLSHVVEPRGIRLRTAGGALWRVLAHARPAKASVLAAAVGRAPNHRRTIRSVVPAGRSDVVTLSTTSGNFVAGGWLVKNCDSAFTWNWDRFDPAVELAERRVDDVVAELAAMDVDRVVVTGGEPMLQQRRLQPFLDAAAERGWAVEVETNGTIAPTAPTAASVERFNVAPKLANSGVPAARRIVPAALAAFVASGKASFKFVVTEPSELDEVAAIVDAHGLAPVVVMPEGTTRDAVVAGARQLADAVTARGWHLTTRLHVLLWGDERGR